jgi:threonine aldolase
MGTLYSVDEIRAIADHTHSLGMSLHLDGARIANAAASLGCSFRDFTTDAGVDVVSFGGTKNGAMLSEAVVVLNPEAAPGVAFLRKSSMQLASKMRFVSAQLLALLTDELWLRNASHANAMARELECRVAGIDGVTVVRPVQANAVFAVLPAEVTARLQERFRFYTWDHTTGEVRWMCAWDTTVEDVEEFATAIAEEMGR